MSSFLEPSQSSTSWSATHEASDVTSLRFSNDGRSLLVGCFNGNVYVRNTRDSSLMYRIQAVISESPITSLRWHPSVPNTVLVAAASGFISSWHIETGQRLWSFREESENGSPNAVHSIDVSPSGAEFCSVGADSVVRLYALASRQLKSSFKTKLYMQGVITGHENRIYSSVYIDNDLLATSGWDNTVILWDVRSGDIVRTIFGPAICGESVVQIDSKVMITGSWRDEDQLQFWDIGTGKNLSTITIKSNKEPLQIYSLALSADKSIVGASGSGVNCASFYSTSDYRFVAQTERFDSCVSNIGFSKDKYAIGLTNSYVYCDYFNQSK